MQKDFGTLKDGTQVSLYTIRGSGLVGELSPYGATLVRLYVPDKNGNLEDVVLGYENVSVYENDWMNIGATVGRCANRIKGGTFELNGKTITLAQNNMGNSLHSGPDFYSHRLWNVAEHTDDSITFFLDSPDGDQGFPGRALIYVTYKITAPCAVEITYRATADADTVINLTHHSCFNLRGHQYPQAALEQELMIPSEYFLPTDDTFVPTGEIWPVADTPMDFRQFKAIGRDIKADYLPLIAPMGYDHSYWNTQSLCAVLQDPVSGRRLSVYTDRPMVHLYSGNFLDIGGKDGVHYCDQSGIALETQFPPDAVHNPQWPQPIVKAGDTLISKTSFCFDTL